MRIAVDAMGGDHAPVEVVKGCVEASRLISHEICLVGDEPRIREELAKYEYNRNQVTVKHAPDVITFEEAPVRAIRTKKESSMVVGINMVKDGEAAIFISAGSSGAIMAGGLFILGRIPGIDRPAIAATIPMLKTGGVALIVDAGANPECKVENLMQFAVMGNLYCKSVFDMEAPRIGLVNMGTEAGKGSGTLKTTYEELTASSLNFVGNVEARDLQESVCDVILCDGMVGNVLLKNLEGTAKTIMSIIQAKFTENVRTKMGAALLLPQIRELKKMFDYSEYGGAPILGVKGALIKMHGSYKANGVKNTILKAIPYAENNVVASIEESVAAMSAAASKEEESSEQQ
ncbi:MAG: phosphate acyltransferase PlsX [Clostridiales bacterium]|nr:phosphate acyltransferase PlsX [Clostridiales bacterium]